MAVVALALVNEDMFRAVQQGMNEWIKKNRSNESHWIETEIERWLVRGGGGGWESVGWLRGPEVRDDSQPYLKENPLRTISYCFIVALALGIQEERFGRQL